MILLVEDDPDLRSVMARYLRFRGYRCLVADSGMEGLRFIQAHAPSLRLILTDRALCDVPGLDIVRHARQLRPDIPAILTSGSAGSDPLPEGVAFLPKPFRLAEAEALIRAKAPDLQRE